MNEILTSNVKLSIEDADKMEIMLRRNKRLEKFKNKMQNSDIVKKKKKKQKQKKEKDLSFFGVKIKPGYVWRKGIEILRGSERDKQLIREIKREKELDQIKERQKEIDIELQKEKEREKIKQRQQIEQRNIDESVSLEQIDSQNELIQDQYDLDDDIGSNQEQYNQQYNYQNQDQDQQYYQQYNQDQDQDQDQYSDEQFLGEDFEQDQELEQTNQKQNFNNNNSKINQQQFNQYQQYNMNSEYDLEYIPYSETIKDQYQQLQFGFDSFNSLKLNKNNIKDEQKIDNQKLNIDNTKAALETIDHQNNNNNNNQQQQQQMGVGNEKNNNGISAFNSLKRIQQSGSYSAIGLLNNQTEEEQNQKQLQQNLSNNINSYGSAISSLQSHIEDLKSGKSIYSIQSADQTEEVKTASVTPILSIKTDVESEEGNDLQLKRMRQNRWINLKQQPKKKKKQIPLVVQRLIIALTVLDCCDDEEVPTYIQIIIPSLSSEQFNRLKQQPLFLSRTAKCCLDCCNTEFLNALNLQIIIERSQE